MAILYAKEKGGGPWVRVVFASDCLPCSGCDEPICPNHQIHFAECSCPGPHQEDEYEYREKPA